MSRKQWYGLGGLLVGLIIIVFLIVFFMNRSDVKRDVAEEAGQEERKEEKKMQSDISNKLNLDYEMLTFMEMESFIKELEKGLEDGETLTEEEIVEALKEEHGVLNALAYSRGVILDGTEDELTVNNVINRLLFAYYFTGEATMEEADKIGVVRTKNLYDYENSLLDDGDVKDKSKVEVFGVSDVLVVDTQGFVEGDNFEVGYPRIKKFTTDELESIKYEDENTGNLEIELDVFVTDDIRHDKFIKKVRDMDIDINGYKAEPYADIYKREQKKETEKELGEMYGGKVGNKTSDNMYDIIAKDHFARVLTVDSINLFMEDIDSEKEVSIEEYEEFQEELLGYLGDREKNTTLLKGGFVTVVYEIDKEAVVGDYDMSLSDLEEYYAEGHEPPKITIDGQEYKFSIYEEGKGTVYYQR